jgi:hypothetical protein
MLSGFLHHIPITYMYMLKLLHNDEILSDTNALLKG